MANLVSIQGEKFIIRCRNYRQDLNYPDLCGQAIADLQTRPPATAHELLERSYHLLQNHHHGEAAERRISPFRIDHIETGGETGTPLHSKRYRPYGKKVFTRFSEIESTGSAALQYQPRDGGSPVTIVTFDGSRLGGDNFIMHMHNPATGSDYDRVFADIEFFFSRAMDSSHTATDRKEAAINAYWLLSTLQPLHRRNAAASDLVLAYMFDSMGLELPFTAENVDINLEAMTLPLDEFRRQFQQGILFDRKATARNIQAWQVSEIDRQADALETYFLYYVKGVRDGCTKHDSSDFDYEPVRQLLDQGILAVQEAPKEQITLTERSAKVHQTLRGAIMLDVAYPSAFERMYERATERGQGAGTGEQGLGRHALRRQAAKDDSSPARGGKKTLPRPRSGDWKDNV